MDIEIVRRPPPTCPDTDGDWRFLEGHGWEPPLRTLHVAIPVVYSFNARATYAIGDELRCIQCAAGARPGVWSCPFCGVPNAGGT